MCLPILCLTMLKNFYTQTQKISFKRIFNVLEVQFALECSCNRHPYHRLTDNSLGVCVVRVLTEGGTTSYGCPGGYRLNARDFFLYHI